jgi:hypothetical protein
MTIAMTSTGCLMPVDAPWAAALAVEDHLGGYGSWKVLADSTKAFVLPVSRDGEYRLCLRLWGNVAELTLLAHGREHQIHSWREEPMYWCFFPNNAGEHQPGDEVSLEIDAREPGAAAVTVRSAGLVVSYWHQDAALPLIGVLGDDHTLA